VTRFSACACFRQAYTACSLPLQQKQKTNQAGRAPISLCSKCVCAPNMLNPSKATSFLPIALPFLCTRAKVVGSNIIPTLGAWSPAPRRKNTAPQARPSQIASSSPSSVQEKQAGPDKTPPPAATSYTLLHRRPCHLHLPVAGAAPPPAYSHQ